MSNSIVSPTQSQDTKLTCNQRAAIDRLLAKYPTITHMSVSTQYEHYNYARNWFIYIEIDPEAYHKFVTITRCDHSWTAATKAQAIRRYIEEKRAGQENNE